MVKTMKVVGVDPSLRNFGIVHADLDVDTLDYKITGMKLVSSEDNAAKLKTVRKNSDDLRRARLLYEGFMEACSLDGVSFAFIEIPVGSQSARAMASYGICVGVLASCPIAMVQVTAGEVKLAGHGVKTATKEEQIEAAMKAHPYAPWKMRKSGGVMVPTNDNEHLADACFAIKAGVQTDQFKGVAAMLRTMPKAA